MAPLIISISGLRGIIGESLTPQVAAEYGMAFGTFLVSGHQKESPPKVCIGRDSRPSGPMVAAALSGGLMAAGCDIVDIGIVTTPGTALMIRHLGCDGGVVLTASHNPVEWNGIKLLRHDGIAFPAEQARQIQQMYYDQQFRLMDSLHVGSAAMDSRAHAVHIDTVLRICDKNLIASKRFKVVLDSVNGAGCVATAQLLSELGCELVHINDRPTGIFAHTPEPTAENLADLGPVVTKNKAVVGFAQDPDADRLAVLDEHGVYVGEEYTLALAAKYMFSKRKGKAAANLSTSRMIDAIAEAAGCSVIRTPVGEAHVANTMIAEECVIGGEGNGGVIDLRVVPVRDSLVGIAMILQLMAETGKTISPLVSEIPSYHMHKSKFPIEPGQAQAILDKVVGHYESLAAGDIRIDTRDGIRIDLPEGWVQLRASNTEPIMRLMAESDSPATTQRLVDEVQGLIPRS